MLYFPTIAVPFYLLTKPLTNREETPAPIPKRRKTKYKELMDMPDSLKRDVGLTDRRPARPGTSFDF